MIKLRMKLILFFVSLMFISSVLSFVIFAFLPDDSLGQELRQNQQEIVISILELEQKTNLNIEEITDMASNFMYDVSIIDSIDSLQMTNDEMNRLKNQETVIISDQRRNQITSVLMIDDTYIEISPHPDNNIFRIIASRVRISLISYIVIGSFLVILLAKSVVKPILKLTAATQEVAKGNFDVEIASKGNDEIAQMIQNFNKMTKELKSIEYLRKDFINSVSHEFKTPIASIQGFAKLLQNDNLPENERHEYTQIIIEETSRLTKLSSNILNLSKLENQEIMGKKIDFSLDEQIRRTILLLEYEWSKKNIEFDIDLENIKYQGDEELLQQVWINILSNAIKFSDEESIITVKLYQMGPIVKIKISDTGIGMSEEIQQRIFEKFYQGDKAHSLGGNGLGLSIAKRIIDICGGIIYVESKIDHGTTFNIELPIVND
ncbi:MAG: HAMP domain-containing sensor histidine kinase [Gudongella sp.]|nr:HAMP domain-containing sensor histidine kinase [Gudongella sp.]